MLIGYSVTNGERNTVNSWRSSRNTMSSLSRLRWYMIFQMPIASSCFEISVSRHGNTLNTKCISGCLAQKTTSEKQVDGRGETSLLGILLTAIRKARHLDDI